MREFVRTVVHSLEAGESVELVSVLEAGGSTPRGAGAMLAVFQTGAPIGTVGGGNVEYEAIQLAKELLASGGSAVRRYQFIQGEAASLGMVCGGDVTLHFQYLPAGDAETISLLRELMAATGGNADVWLIRKLEEERVVGMGLVSRTRSMTDGGSGRPAWK